MRDTHPSLRDRDHWEELGRAHGRRAVPADTGKSHVVAAALRHTLLRAIIENRKASAEQLQAIDRDRHDLRCQRTRLTATTATTPPGADRLASSLAAVDQELATWDMARRAVNEALELTTRQLCETAAQADAAFRESYEAGSRLKGVLPAPADLDLPTELRGPIPDPLEDQNP